MMDEKISSPDGPLPPLASESQRRHSRGSMWTRPLRITIAVLLLLFFVLGHARLALDDESHRRLKFPEEQSVVEESVDDEWKVPLDVHIMSKCPDALACLEQLVVPAMSQTVSKVNFTLSYIGTPTDPDDGVSCMHGPSECLGNILELCAAELYPDPKIYLGFTLCLSQRYHEIPSRELVHNCALEHGIAFEDLNECASRDEGSFGTGLLRNSVRHSAEVGVRVSCTVRLNETVRCVRDGGEWKNCEGGSSVQDLVGDVERLWKTGNAKDGDEEWILV